VLAAGGVEREAIEWLETRDVPADVSLFVVGVDTGRRIATHAVAQGASDYFALPEDAEILRNKLVAAVERHREVSSRPSAKNSDPTGAFARIVGESPALKVVLERATRLLGHPRANALIVGESGTGKELLARSIHDGGPRRESPFVSVHCSAFPSDLLDAELFGYEKEAIPEAHASKPGLFEVADGGTVFLDEVQALSADLQVKLLLVLEDRQTHRLGATRGRPVNVRVIAATTEDLQDAVRRRTFRRDLLARLGAITLDLPPLRDRGDDLILVAERLLAVLAVLHEMPVPELRGEVQRALREHSWPGNIRELKNALERALLLSAPGTLAPGELLPVNRVSGGWRGLPFPAALDEIASAAARSTLDACGGNVSRAARQLQVSRARLRRLVHAAPDSRLIHAGPGGEIKTGIWSAGV